MHGPSILLSARKPRLPGRKGTTTDTVDVNPLAACAVFKNLTKLNKSEEEEGPSARLEIVQSCPVT